MTKLYHTRESAEASFPTGSWQSVVYKELVGQLTSDLRPFPCTFAINGYRNDDLRFLFQETPNIPEFGEQLAMFLEEARSIGQNAALLYLTGMETVEPLEDYSARFWTILNELAKIDRKPWPEDIPQDLDNPEWEFCFNGEPIFVVCTNPAHVKRQSRRSSTFAMSLQPRWVFDRILFSDRAANIVFNNIRKRMQPYDALPPSPALGRYKDPNVREAQQYVLSEDDSILRCPFHQLESKQVEDA